MFACPGLIFYSVCSVPWLNGNLALAEKCSGPLRFRLRQVLLYKYLRKTIVHFFGGFIVMNSLSKVYGTNNIKNVTAA